MTTNYILKRGEYHRNSKNSEISLIFSNMEIIIIVKNNNMKIYRWDWRIIILLVLINKMSYRSTMNKESQQVLIFVEFIIGVFSEALFFIVEWKINHPWYVQSQANLKMIACADITCIFQVLYIPSIRIHGIN